MSGWCLTLFGGITLLMGLSDPAALAMGAGLLLCAILELRGAAGLRRLDPRSPERLALNQLLLAIVLVGYAGLRIFQSRVDPRPMSSSLSDPQVAQMLGSFDDLARDITTGFYGLIMLIGIVVPGLTAIYYKSRRKHLELFASTAAPWIVALHRKGIRI
jgi:hypothetical protein